MINEKEFVSPKTSNKSCGDESAFTSISPSKKKPINANYSVKKKKASQTEESFLPDDINAAAKLNPPLIKMSIEYNNMLIDDDTNEFEGSYCKSEEDVDERKSVYESKEELYTKIPFRNQVNSAKHLLSTELASPPKRILGFCNKREDQRPKIPPPRKKSHQTISSNEFTPNDKLLQGFSQTYDEISNIFTKDLHITQSRPPALSALEPTKEKDDKIRPTLSNLKRSRSKMHGLSALDYGEFLKFKSKFIPNYYNNAENKTFSDTVIGKIGRSNSSTIETGRIKHARMRKFSDQIKYKNSNIFNLIESKSNILSFSKEKKRNNRFSKTLTNKKRYRASISLKLGKKYQILTSHSDVSTDGSITNLNYWQLDEKYNECSVYQQYIPGSVNNFSHLSEKGDLDVTESPYATIDNNDSVGQKQSCKIQNLSKKLSNIYLKPTFYESVSLADLTKNTEVKKTLLQLTIDSNLYKKDEKNYKIAFDIYQPLPTHPAQSTKSSVHKTQFNAEVRSCLKNDDEGFVDGCPQNIQKCPSAENFVEKICENNFVLFIKNFCVNDEDFVNEHTPLKFDNE